MVKTKQHLQFIVWTQSNALTGVCMAFRQEACQTIAQETVGKWTAWGYRDESDYTIHGAKQNNMDTVML